MDSLDKRPKLRKMDMRFGTWNERSLNGAGSLVTIVKEISKYKLDLVGVQVGWDRGGMNQQANVFFYGKGNENHELGTGFSVHKRFITAVKRTEFVSDRMPCIILQGCWCDITALNVQAPADNKLMIQKTAYMRN
jgi:hypothetical protein